MERGRLALVLAGCVVLLLSLTSCGRPVPPPTRIPEELAQQISDTYERMILILGNAVVLREAAELEESGELADWERVALLIALMARMQEVEDSLPGFVPPEGLEDFWDDMIFVHMWTRLVPVGWLRMGFLSTAVMDEMKPMAEFTAETVAEVERNMVERFGFDAALLAERRQEAVGRAVRLLEFPEFEP